jgi:hypothetical protein
VADAVSVPDLRVEVAWSADPLAATYAKAVLTGASNSYATTPDTAALRITGDIDIVARLSMSDWTPAATQVIVSKSLITLLGWYLGVTTTGQLQLQTSADGTTGITQASTAGPFTNGTAYWVRATLDVDDGAGNRVYNFYWAPDAETEPLSWTPLSTHTVSGTTSINATTVQVEVGSQGLGNSRLAGDIHRVIVRDGIGGTVRADFDPSDALASSSTSWNSCRVSGQAWTLAAAASLSIAPAWSDITADVRDSSVRISRGKGSEIPTYASSSLSLTLNNRSRKYDPEYASSPLHPNVKPRKRIRVRATWASTTHTIWTGYIDSFPQRYPMANFDSVVELQAYDALALLNDVVLDDAAYAYARDTVGDLQLALRTAAGRTWVDDIAGVQYYRRRGVAATGDGLGVGPSTGVELDGNSYWSWAPPPQAGTPVIAGTAVTYACWFRVDSLHASLTRTLFGTTQPATTIGGVDVTALRVGVTAAGKVIYSSGSDSAYTTGDYGDGLAHHLVITHTGSTVVIYVDGVDVTDPASAPWWTANPAVGVNLVGYLPNATANAYFDGAVSDLMVFSKALSAGQVTELYRLSAGSMIESTGSRGARILALAGVPAGLRSMTDAGRGTVADIDTWGQSALAALQQVADSEQGRLFVDTRGDVTLQDRYWWQSSPRGRTAQATFSDDLADLYYLDVGADRSLREVQNSVEVTGSQGLRGSSADSASVAAYGTRSASLSTILSTQGQVDDLAIGLVALRKEPVTRLDAITVRPAMQTSAWPDVLRLELGDRIVHEIMPARGAASTSQVSRTLIVERLDWSITASDWTAAITGSPIPALTIFTLDQSLLDGTDVLGF